MTIFADVSLPVTAVPPGGHVSVDDDLSFELERVVPTGSAAHYLWVIGDGYESAVNHLRDDSAVESISTLDEFATRALVRVRWKRLRTPLFDLVDENDGLLVEAVGTMDGWAATFQFPDEAALVSFYEVCQRCGIAVELRGVTGARFGNTADTNALSSVQRDTLETAFQEGYFEVPRRTTIAELAEGMELSEQAVSERLRRALANYLSATLLRDGLSEADGTDRDG